MKDCNDCKYKHYTIDEEPCISCMNSLVKNNRLYSRWEPMNGNSSRISKDGYYMGIAKAVSRRSTCLRRNYGAVIVKDDEIISTGYNGAPRGDANCCDAGSCFREGEEHNNGNYAECPAVHAEMNAIISASRSEMLGAKLYLYGSEFGKTIDAEPCPICARLIKNAGIIDVIKSKAGEPIE